MEAFGLPGMAIAVISAEETRVKGYGVRALGQRGKIDANTIFGIHSNSKAFTAAAMAILVDEGKIAWDDKVTDYLPQFQMFDSWVTREFRVRDLFIHSSGLAYNAGGLMVGPGTTFTAPEVVTNLRYLEPITSFRTEFAYSNLMYVVAGELIASVSGVTWEDFVDARIIKPLGMTNCAADLARLASRKNIAEAHVVTAGVVQVQKRKGRLATDVSGPAGGIHCSAKAMARWTRLMLDEGRIKEGVTLFSSEQFDEITAPYTVMPVSPSAATSGQTHFSAYGLGWNLSDYHGYKQITHTGADAGMVSQVMFFPELDFGLVLLLNHASAEALGGVRQSILQTVFSDGDKDWIAVYRAQEQQMAGMLAGAMQRFGQAGNASDLSLPMASYAGTYRDPWFGDVVVEEQGEGLYFRSDRLRDLKGKMLPVEHNRFIVRWDDPGLEVLNAFALFELDFDGHITGLSMRAVLPFIPAGFEDLALKRMN